jgi:hypothetical protein
MLSTIVKACKTIIHHVKETIKNFTKPETTILAAVTVSAITYSRKELVAENAIPRETIDLIQDMAQKTGSGELRRFKANF